MPAERGYRAGAAFARRAALYVALTAAAVYFLVPVYVPLVTALKSFADVNLSEMWSPPRRLSLDGFGRALEKLSPNLLNSLALTLPATVVSSLLGSLNGYVFAKWRFRGADLLFVLILFGMFIPYQSILIPLVQFLSSVGLYGRLSGLIVVHIIYGLPITTLVFRNYYADIPDSLLEAAQIDGQGFFALYGSVVFPLSVPAFVVVIIWQFTNIWNEFLFAVIITQNPKTQPITVALQNLAGSQIVEWNVQMAGALVAALPTLVVYIFLGRYFIRGLLAGSVKA